jgi:hypothetical protein
MKINTPILFQRNLYLKINIKDLENNLIKKS